VLKVNYFLFFVESSFKWLHGVSRVSWYHVFKSTPFF